MADLLTKEKQFLKLNEELNRMTVTATTAPVAAPTANDNKFCTYQKSKGPSTLLRKQGAGDGVAEMPGITTGKEHRTNTMAANTAAGGETYRLSNPRHSENSKSSFRDNILQCHPKCYESIRSPVLSGVGNGGTGPSNNGTFNIIHRNPRFLESPSSDMMVKDESPSLRCQTESTSRSGSANSATIKDGMPKEPPCPNSSYTVSAKKNISSEGLIKFLKSKIVILEEDHERISQEMSKQKELLNKALEHTTTLEQQRDQAKAKTNSLNEQLTKTEKRLQETNQRLKECGMEQNSLNKEWETAKRELKLLTQSNNNLEKRLFRANEDLQSARSALALMKTSEREQKETARKELEAKDVQIRSLKQQRANLLNAYKKQLFLIDNLKRQNILLEHAKMLDIGEKEFAKILDWNGKS